MDDTKRKDAQRDADKRRDDRQRDAKDAEKKK